jgi:hypothetical protein
MQLEECGLEMIFLGFFSIYFSASTFRIPEFVGEDGHTG